MHNVLKLITQEERASSQIHLKSHGRLANRMHCFHQGATNCETQKYADPSKLGRSLLEGNKDHLLSQARSEVVKQEHQVGSLSSCINELQQQAYAQGLELQDAHHGYIESRREQVRLQEELVARKSSSRNSNSKYARDGRKEESSETTSWRILSTEINFTIAVYARTNEFYERTWITGKRFFV